MQFKNDIEIFDKYQNGGLSDVERVDFETQLDSDSQLKAAFEEYQTMVEGIRYAERQRLKQELLTSKPAKSNIRSMARHWGRIGVAASLALLVSFGIYLCSNSDARIYAEYDLGRSNVIMSTGTLEVANDKQLFEEAMQFKEEKDFENALEKLEQISENNTNAYFLAQFNQALILVKIGQKDKARGILEELIERPEKHFIKAKSKKMLRDLNKSCFFF